MMTLPARLAVILTVWVALISSSTCSAQLSSSLPSTGYFLGFRTFFEGEYRDAEGIFDNNSSSAFRFGKNRYVDSICYLSLIHI